MKNTTFIFLLLCIAFAAQAQKPAIDSATFGKWPRISNTKISNNGKYSIYTVFNGLEPGRGILHIVSNKDGKEIVSSPMINDATFLNDSRYVIFKHSKDSLGLVKLSSGRLSWFVRKSSYKVCESGTNGWIALLGEDNTLVIKSFHKKNVFVLNNVHFYDFSRDGRRVLFDCFDNIHQQENLKWLNLENGFIQPLWTGKHIGRYSFDNSCTYLVFAGIESNKKGEGVYYYHDGMSRAVCGISVERLMREGLQLGQGVLQFSKNADKVLFPIERLSEIDKTEKVHNGLVTIWSYKDTILQSSQRLAESPKPPSLWAVWNISTSKIVRLNSSDEEIRPNGDFENYCLVYKFEDDIIHWDNPFTLYLVSVKDGQKTKIFNKCILNPYEDFVTSPDESFVVWFDPYLRSYCDYEIAKGVTRSLGDPIKANLYNQEEAEKGRLHFLSYGLCGWSVKENSVFIYDQYDIWKVYLLGNKPPVSVTNGYGRQHNVVFGIPINHYEGYLALENFDDNKSILLSLFNPTTKENALLETDTKFQKKIDVMFDSCSYWVARTGFRGFIQTPSGWSITQARDAKVFIVRKETSSKYPNLQITNDFNHYRQISFLAPESEYNWMRTKLITWIRPDSSVAQGILYLPEDFDSTRRYPVIFECYEKMSDALHIYESPEFCVGRINIPYYVSNDYLVFEPDINWKGHHMGVGVVNTLVSVAKYLSRYSWIDSNKFGLQGHSFGGWVADYAVTHTHVFAAVCAAAGVSDDISGYGELTTTGQSFQRCFEIDQGGFYGIGVTPWTATGTYIENSPIFGIEEVTTPLLIMHGESDAAVPFAQGLEMYLSMRRAGKKVWLLEYDNQGHNLHSKEAEADYTKRMKQFFDLYLKDMDAPEWMTNAVPYYQSEGKNELNAGSVQQSTTKYERK